MKSVEWLKICGVCGILLPVIAFTFILLAITSYPQFSWTENALSDLGVQEGITAILFNSGLVTGGILALVFAFGLFKILGDKALGKVGAFSFILVALALTSIGVFPESVKPTHYYASVMFFTLFPISAFIISATFLLKADLKMGFFTFLVASVAMVVWITHWTVGLGSNVAVPEMLSAIPASAWCIVLGFKMLKAKASKQ
ncbi:MAG: DUF998 domain-containing protein [Candidatus Bathyarchaeia archaeon]